jgi:hypothetical protein
MIESILYFNCFTRIFCDIKKHKIIFLEIVSQEEEGMKRLGKYSNIFDFKEIAVDGVERVHAFLI